MATPAGLPARDAGLAAPGSPNHAGDQQHRARHHPGQPGPARPSSAAAASEAARAGQVARRGVKAGRAAPADRAAELMISAATAAGSSDIGT